MKQKIIIFGATGNVGSYLSLYAQQFFKDKEFEVILTSRRQTNVFDTYGLLYISVDITRSEDFERLPQDNVYAVILLAAEIPSYMHAYDARKYLDSIVIGGYNVLEYCREVKADRILYSQTVFDVSLYPHEQLLDPCAQPNFSYKGDHAMYVIAKNSMLEMMEHYHQEYGLKTFVFRFPTIYCYSPYPYYFPNGIKTMRPLYRMIEKAQKGEPLEIWGDPNYAKDMVYVYDCAQMMCKAVLVDKDKAVYNVGTGKPVTLDEQIHAIVEVFSPKDNPSPIIYCPNKPCGGGFLMDISNAVQDLEYQSQYTCQALLEDMKKEMQLQRFVALRVNVIENTQGVDNELVTGGG